MSKDIHDFVHGLVPTQEKVATDLELEAFERLLAEAGEEEKVAYGMMGVGSEDWLCRFQHTPLYEKAIALKEKDLALEKRRMEERQRREKAYRHDDSTWNEQDRLCLEKDKLTLELHKWRASQEAKSKIKMQVMKIAGNGDPLREKMKRLGQTKKAAQDEKGMFGVKHPVTYGITHLIHRGNAAEAKKSLKALKAQGAGKVDIETLKEYIANHSKKAELKVASNDGSLLSPRGLLTRLVTSAAEKVPVRRLLKTYGRLSPKLKDLPSHAPQKRVLDDLNFEITERMAKGAELVEYTGHVNNGEPQAPEWPRAALGVDSAGRRATPDELRTQTVARSPDVQHVAPQSGGEEFERKVSSLVVSAAGGTMVGMGSEVKVARDDSTLSQRVFGVKHPATYALTHLIHRGNAQEAKKSLKALKAMPNRHPNARNRDVETLKEYIKNHSKGSR